VQFGQEGENVSGEYLRILGRNLANHLHAGWDIRVGHCLSPGGKFYMVKNDFAE
jgi:hypothetical protein